MSTSPLRTDRDSPITVGLHLGHWALIWHALETHLRYEREMILKHRQDSGGSSQQVRDICAEIKAQIVRQDTGGEAEHVFGGPYPIMEAFARHSIAPLHPVAERPRLPFN